MKTRKPFPPRRETYRPLYHYRLERGLSRLEVAALLLVSETAIRKAETTDPYAIGLAKYQQLAAAWDIPLADFDPPAYRHLSQETPVP